MQFNKDGSVRKDQLETAKKLGVLTKENKEDGKLYVDKRCKAYRDMKKYKEYEENTASNYDHLKNKDSQKLS
jgi:hypothetical protein